jgi:broad specificity phosphatase PhoE
MRKIWLVRHGQRLDFVRPEWFLTAPYPYDPPLSALGIYQALALVQQLPAQGIGQLLCSPHLRALQTAQPLAQALQLEINVEFGLREWLHPDWSDRLPILLPPTENLVPIKTSAHYQSLIQPQYPETESDLVARADRLVAEIILSLATDVVIVAHKHILLSAISILNGSDWSAFALEPASVVLLGSTEHTKGSWNVLQP